jgi:hypothetical protein
MLAESVSATFIFVSLKISNSLSTSRDEFKTTFGSTEGFEQSEHMRGDSK